MSIYKSFTCWQEDFIAIRQKHKFKTIKQEQIPGYIESATQITTASDLTNRRYYFHTMSNRQVRMIDLAKIDFAKVKEQIVDVDAGAKHVVREIIVTDGR